MVGILEDKRSQIAAACADHHQVQRLDVFGSAVRDDFQPGDSDVDLLVDFGQMDPYDRIDAYFDLLEKLRGLLGADVDLVMVDAVKNRYIAADIERT